MTPTFTTAAEELVTNPPNWLAFHPVSKFLACDASSPPPPFVALRNPVTLGPNPLVAELTSTWAILLPPSKV